MIAEEHQIRIKENLQWQLEAKPTLDAYLFDEHRKLHPQVQELLLNQAEDLIKNCLQQYPWFEVDDIILYGVSASYYYNSASEIEISIILHRKETESPFSNDYRASRFLNKVLRTYYMQGRKYWFERRMVDIKTSFVSKSPQQYSLLHDCWLAEPSIHENQHKNVDEIINRTENLMKEIEYTCNEQFEMPNGKYKLKDIRDMQRLYLKLMKKDISPENSGLIRRLLRYTGYLKKFKNYYNNELAKSLSV